MASSVTSPSCQKKSHSPKVGTPTVHNMICDPQTELTSIYRVSWYTDIQLLQCVTVFFNYCTHLNTITVHILVFKHVLMNFCPNLINPDYHQRDIYGLTTHCQKLHYYAIHNTAELPLQYSSLQNAFYTLNQKSSNWGRIKISHKKIKYYTLFTHNTEFLHTLTLWWSHLYSASHFYFAYAWRLKCYTNY